MLKNLFRSRTVERPGLALYANAVDQARRPAFYTALGVSDEIDARFELYTLHVLLLVLRLRDEPGERGAEAAQDLFDVYVSALDNALRELGVHDVSIAKKMRKLGEALYGRMTAYEGPIRSGDTNALQVGLARNVYENGEGAGATGLADYALAARAMLATQDIGTVLSQPRWPEVEA